MDVVDVVAVVAVVAVVEAEVNRANEAVFDLFIVWLVSQTEGCGPVYKIVYTVESGLASSSQKIYVFYGWSLTAPLSCLCK